MCQTNSHLLQIFLNVKIFPKDKSLIMEAEHIYCSKHLKKCLKLC